jgi:hypothetical protein
MPDSRRGPLPLADALIAWSDPALLEAVRAAEAGHAPDELERLERDPLDRISDRRAVPRQGRVPMFGGGAEGIRALDRAWGALLDAFRGMVGRGEVFLEGEPVGPRLPLRGRIPATAIERLEFDPRGAAVFFNGRTYADVTASKAPPDHLEVLRASVAADTERARSLRDALVLWADAALVKRVRRLERLVADVNGRPLRFARLFERTREPFDWSTTPAAEQMRPEVRLAEAWAELLTDARRRIEVGEWEVRGVQTFPLRETERAPIPGVWAAEFWFDVEANTISVVQFNRTARTYAAVLIRRDAAVGPTVDRGTWAHDGEVPGGTPAAEPGVEDAAIAAARGACSGAAHAAQGTSATGDTDDAAARANGVRRGRESAEPAIEAVVRACWDEVHARASVGGRTPVWTELARMVERRMQAASRRGDIPQVWRFHTIRKHLPEIYARVLSEKDAAGQSA